MANIDPAILALAENLNMHMPQRPSEQCIIRSRYAVVIGVDPDPRCNVVQRLRLQPGEVSTTVNEVRLLLAACGRHRATWEVGDSATPPDLAERLCALGMVPDELEPLAVGMVLTRPLERTTSEVVVRRVVTLDEFRISTSIFRNCFGGSNDDESGVLEQRFAQHQAVTQFERYLAWLGNAPVATGDAMYLEAGVVLCGGATLPQARGQGAYRALITARWEEGMRRGTPTLVTQAGSMSRPILRRLGFEEVVKVRIFLDEFERIGVPDAA